VSFARYEVLLPQRYNDGSPVEQSKLEETWFELVQQFGSLTVDPTPQRGVWTHQLERFEDELVKVILDLEDLAETEAFMRSYKEILKLRFDQLDIWMVAFPIRIL
jgi:hypothetical protein